MSQQRVAIITGAGQGIGAGVARSFAAAGYRVSLMSPSDRSLRSIPMGRTARFDEIGQACVFPGLGRVQLRHGPEPPRGRRRQPGRSLT